MVDFRSATWCVAVCLAVGMGSAALADDAISRGQSVYDNRCKECHEAPPEARKAGPSLIGVVGRQAGTLPGFAYSDAMKAAGFIWTEDQLRAYLLNPRAVVPGNRMPFNGLKRPGEDVDIVAYLKSLSPQ